MANKRASYFFKKNGVFQFIRRVPLKLQHHYKSGRISFSLNTKDQRVAANRAKMFASRLDDFWFQLRMQDHQTLGRFLKKTSTTPPVEAVVNVGAVSAVVQAENPAPKFSEARKLYLSLRGRNRTPNFYRAVERDCNLLIKLCGDKPIDQYVRTDAIAFRDHLFKEGLAGKSVVRILSTIKAILSFAATEQGIPSNAFFSRLYIDRSLGANERQPISLPNIRIIQQRCFQWNDEKRWIVALISDTGMRLGEAVGLIKSDFKVIDGIHVVKLIPHPWRRLKTKNSERTVPLVGWSLWAKERILQSGNASSFAFPCYNKDKLSNSGSASAALGKWLETQLPGCGTIHGFRHSLRDRLRSIECPSDIVDQIGGWTTSGIGHSYGQGYSSFGVHHAFPN